jgi:hypothetical protein
VCQLALACSWIKRRFPNHPQQGHIQRQTCLQERFQSTGMNEQIGIAAQAPPPPISEHSFPGEPTGKAGCLIVSQGSCGQIDRVILNISLFLVDLECTATGWRATELRAIINHTPAQCPSIGYVDPTGRAPFVGWTLHHFEFHFRAPHSHP